MLLDLTSMKKLTLTQAKASASDDEQDEVDKDEWGDDDYAALAQHEEEHGVTKAEDSPAESEEFVDDGTIESVLRLHKANFNTDAELKRVLVLRWWWKFDGFCVGVPICSVLECGYIN